MLAATPSQSSHPSQVSLLKRTGSLLSDDGTAELTPPNSPPLSAQKSPLPLNDIGDINALLSPTGNGPSKMADISPTQTTEANDLDSPRQEIYDHLQKVKNNGKPIVIVVYGPGGAGKSTMSLKLVGPAAEKAGLSTHLIENNPLKQQNKFTRGPYRIILEKKIICLKTLRDTLICRTHKENINKLIEINTDLLTKLASLEKQGRVDLADDSTALAKQLKTLTKAEKKLYSEIENDFETTITRTEQLSKLFLNRTCLSEAFIRDTIYQIYPSYADAKTFSERMKDFNQKTESPLKAEYFNAVYPEIFIKDRKKESVTVITSHGNKDIQTLRDNNRINLIYVIIETTAEFKEQSTDHRLRTATDHKREEILKSKQKHAEEVRIFLGKISEIKDIAKKQKIPLQYYSNNELNKDPKFIESHNF